MEKVGNRVGSLTKSCSYLDDCLETVMRTGQSPRKVDEGLRICFCFGPSFSVETREIDMMMSRVISLSLSLSVSLVNC